MRHVGGLIGKREVDRASRHSRLLPRPRRRAARRRGAEPARIGPLSIGADPSRPVAWSPFLERLRELGYVEGENITIERRFAAGRRERLDELVADLAHLRVDIIVATGVPENLAAKRAMPTTPIVMMVVPDPVGEGLVASLARPGGNVTGLSTLAPELYAKRLELLKEAIPAVTRVGLLSNPANAHSAAASREITTAARVLGVQIHGLVVRNPQDLDRAFLTITRERLQAVAKSVRLLAGALQAMGHRVSRQLVAELLVAAGYSLQANRKTREGANHPDRDAQYRYINQQVQRFQAAAQPVISVDTKKKELVGDFKNAGRQCGPTGRPRTSCDERS